jgi:hypothetical protein
MIRENLTDLRCPVVTLNAYPADEFQRQRTVDEELGLPAALPVRVVRSVVPALGLHEAPVHHLHHALKSEVNSVVAVAALPSVATQVKPARTTAATEVTR